MGNFAKARVLFPSSVSLFKWFVSQSDILLIPTRRHISLSSRGSCIKLCRRFMSDLVPNFGKKEGSGIKYLLSIYGHNSWAPKRRAMTILKSVRPKERPCGLSKYANIFIFFFPQNACILAWLEFTLFLPNGIQLSHVRNLFPGDF